MQPVHPGWCDPQYCRFTDIDVQHRSTPTLLSTCEHDSEQHGDTELLIDVHNTMLRVPDVQHVLRAREIGLYASRLLAERHRAQLLGESVVTTTFMLEPMRARRATDPRRSACMDRPR